MSDHHSGQDPLAVRRKIFSIQKGPAIAWILSFLICALFILLNRKYGVYDYHNKYRLFFGNGSEADFRTVIARVIFLFISFCIFTYFCSGRFIGRSLRNREVYFIAVLAVLYFASGFIFTPVIIPVTLFFMLPCILINFRLALLLAVALPLSAYLSGVLYVQNFIYAILSGIAAVCAVKGAARRMDLLRAGMFIAAINVAVTFAALLLQQVSLRMYPLSLILAALNGIISGMLVLGCLAPLERALGAITTFRLIELSDLNTPVLKQLFTVAPGTYNHSLMVANLAEAACQEIGANSLLARVGSYYHDLGKMENPGYFVENQINYNCHDDMEPEASADVIRRHVKLGVEKGRQLGLPIEVIDIISEHHGNSVITWFYDKALRSGSSAPAGSADSAAAKKSGNNGVCIEDFIYPGNPPRSRESTVVMLADICEAAARTLDDRSAVKLEKFIQELFDNKVGHTQLVRAELSLRELEIVKNAFVRVLAAQNHSRIDYPKIDDKAAR